MKFLRMVFVNCKRYFKDYKVILLMFILPFACTGLVNLMMEDGKRGSNIDVAIVNSDRGTLGQEFIKGTGVDLYDNKENDLNNKEKALNELKKYNYIAVYEIPENFSDTVNSGLMPEIKAYKLQEGNNTQIFETNLENKLKEMLKEEILQQGGLIKDGEELSKNFIKLQYNKKSGFLDQNEFMPIVMIMFYLCSFSSTFITDLLNLRKGKILERFLSTNNRGYEIMGSIYLSMLIVQGVLYTASFIALDLIFKYNFQNFGLLILNILLMSMVCISLIVMLSRIFKEPSVASIVLTLTTMSMFFLYMIAMIGETSSKVPAVLITLSKFTPFYWSLGSIEQSILFPNAIVLILMALVFFSAGSIRYSNFAKE